MFSNATGTNLKPQQRISPLTGGFGLEMLLNGIMDISKFWDVYRQISSSLVAIKLAHYKSKPTFSVIRKLPIAL